ncbi:MAG: hypothetical protein ISR65_08370 [Bacteriovoracaceae bacterium]|nr:hypothetical protein [Bacteriovoracaceae bacterium]
MPKFALYYVPPCEGELEEFYRLGSSLLTYDVRKNLELDPNEHFKSFKSDWTKLSQEYGFHVTIGDAINFSLDVLPQIEKEIEDILKVLNPSKKWLLTPKTDAFVGLRGEDKEIIVLNYDANTYLQLFHTMVVCKLHPCGTGSLYSDRKRVGSKKSDNRPSYIDNKVDIFHTNTGLDDYRPHFTLFNPYRYPDIGSVQNKLQKMFAPFCQKSIEVETISLLVQDNDTSQFRIIREFCRADYE